MVGFDWVLEDPGGECEGVGGWNWYVGWMMYVALESFAGEALNAALGISVFRISMLFRDIGESFSDHDTYLNMIQRRR